MKQILVIALAFILSLLQTSLASNPVEINYESLPLSAVRTVNLKPNEDSLYVQINNINPTSKIEEVLRYAFFIDLNDAAHKFEETEIEHGNNEVTFKVYDLEGRDSIRIFNGSEKQIVLSLSRKDNEPQDTNSEVVKGTGIPIHDAILIHNLLANPATNFNSIINILRLYILPDSIKNNPFLKNVIPGILTAQSSGGGLSKLVTSLGEANVTNFADGLSRFIVARTKEELTIYFFEDFKKFINEGTYSTEIKELFPSTSTILRVVDQEIYDYQKYLPALREAFHEDLREVLTNTSDWLGSNSNIVKAFEERDQKLYGATRFAVDIASQINEGTHPGDVLSHFTDENGTDYLSRIDATFPSVLQTINIVSQSLRSIEAEHYWIQGDMLRNLKNDEILTIYLGLLYERIPEDLTLNQTKLKGIVAPWANNLNEARKALNKWTHTLSEIDKALENIKSAEEDNYIYAARLVEHTTGLATDLSRTLAIFKKNDPDSAAYAEIMTKINIYASYTSSIFASITNKTWHTTVFETYLILSEIWGEDSKFNQQFLRYGTFMAAVASAENSIEVKEAIEAIALPSGSSRIKREAKWNIALNAYTGPFFGQENLPTTTVEEGNANNYSSVIGLSVPVGIAFSHGFKRCNMERGGKSISLFLSIIDIGAITSFRFKDNEAEAIPEIQLKNIMAPGALVMFGFGKLPLSAGIGGQIGPGLREVTPDFANIYDGYYTRWFVTVAVDIPLLNVYTRTR